MTKHHHQEQQQHQYHNTFVSTLNPATQILPSSTTIPATVMTKPTHLQARSPSLSPPPTVAPTSEASVVPVVERPVIAAESPVSPKSKNSTIPQQVLVETAEPVAQSESFVTLPTSTVDMATNTDAIALRAAISLLTMQRERCKRDIIRLQQMKTEAMKNPDEFAKKIKSTLQSRPPASKSRTFQNLSKDEITEATDKLNIPKPIQIYRCPSITWGKYGIVPIQPNTETLIPTGPIDLSNHTAPHPLSKVDETSGQTLAVSPSPTSWPHALTFTPRTGLGSNSYNRDAPLRSYKSPFENISVGSRNGGGTLMYMATAQ